MDVLDRYNTWEYIYKKYNGNGRLIVSRYNDGEYLLMNGLKGHVAEDISIGGLLIQAIKKSGQFVCINYLKPHNYKNKDIWYNTHNYLKTVGDHKWYGCGSWINDDFCNDSVLLSKLFSGNVLLVTGWGKEASLAFSNINPNMKVLDTPTNKASAEYFSIRDKVKNFGNECDTILFACGPLSKVLLADMITECTCDMIDVGAVINAILGLTDKWPMSWVKNINLNEKRSVFFSNVSGYGYRKVQ